MDMVKDWMKKNKVTKCRPAGPQDVRGAHKPRKRSKWYEENTGYAKLNLS